MGGKEGNIPDSEEFLKTPARFLNEFSRRVHARVDPSRRPYFDSLITCVRAAATSDIQAMYGTTGYPLLGTSHELDLNRSFMTTALGWNDLFHAPTIEGIIDDEQVMSIRLRSNQDTPNRFYVLPEEKIWRVDFLETGEILGLNTHDRIPQVIPISYLWDLHNKLKEITRELSEFGNRRAIQDRKKKTKRISM